MRRVRARKRPQEPYPNGFAFPGVFGEERTNPVREAAHDWNVKAARAATIEPPDRPSAKLGIEGTNRDGSIRTGRDFKNVVVNVAKAAECLLRHAHAGEAHPL